MVTEKLNLETHLRPLTELIQKSFRTVADDFELNEKTAPTNPAFIKSRDILKVTQEKEMAFYGYSENQKLVGCYALEKASQQIYYLERLAVDPGYRHKGLGKKLVQDARERVRNSGGEKISIGIIDEHKRLKNWYIDLGFQIKGLKRFEHLPFTVCFLEISVLSE
ncbi:MAG: GNAT family N-acetyltransferase [Spirochaetes bacterium]|nr:GNAT family N-acetyltransferase [Spirochaetota bacterium]